MRKNGYFVKSLIHFITGISTLTIGLGLPSQSMACTGFAITQNGTTYIAKNFDRPLSQGKMLVNPRGVSKVAFPVFLPLAPAKWTSKYGSVTFNQAGVNFPFSGMNERKLVVEVLSFKESVYPTDSKLPVISEAEWTQYILDTSASLAEAEANARKVQVKTIVKGLHYFVCDASKECAMFEYTAGDLEVYRFQQGEIPVVSNTRFPDQIKLLQKLNENKAGFYLALSKIPEALNSMDSSGVAAVPTEEILAKQKEIDAELAGLVDTDILNALRDEDLRRPLIASARLQDNLESATTPVAFSMNLLAEVRLWDTRWNTVYVQDKNEIWFRMFNTNKSVLIGTKRFNYSCRGNGLPKGIDLKEIDKTITMMPKIHNISASTHIADVKAILTDAKVPAPKVEYIAGALKKHIEANYKCVN